MNRQTIRRGLTTIAMLAGFMGAGCSGRVSLWPNSDPALRKTPAQFAADAAVRHPFKADAPRGGQANGRASVDYGLDILQVANLSDEDWSDIEIWVNRDYVIFIPKIEKGAKRVTTINFQMLFNTRGESFPTNNVPAANQIHQVEMLRDGKMYDVKLQLADS